MENDLVKDTGGSTDDSDHLVKDAAGSTDDSDQGSSYSIKELEELELFIKELVMKISAKVKLREKNLKCTRPPEEYFSRLDSCLKKNIAFVKRLKQFATTQLDFLLRDMSSLNLTKYISEVCAALVEAKLTMDDVPAAITLCSKLHQIYVDFSHQFLAAWCKILHIKAGGKFANPSKLRIDLCFFAELVSSGVINTKQGLALLGNALTNIISRDKADHRNFSIILSFCLHCGEEYAGLIPKRILDLGAMHNVPLSMRSNFLSSEKQQKLRKLLRNYHSSLSGHLLSVQNDLHIMTINIRKTMETGGEVSNETKERFELMQANFVKLLDSTNILSELLNEPVPEISQHLETAVSSGIVLESLKNNNFGDLDPWEDDEVKNFYVNLPNLREVLPNFKAPKQDHSIPEDPAMTEDILDLDTEPEVDVDEQSTDSSTTPMDSVTPEPPEEPNSASSKQEGIVPTNTKDQFKNFLLNLNKCVNKKLIDSAAIEFLLNFNTKKNRKKVTTFLFGVHRNRLDLLPFFARFIAIVHMMHSDVSINLAHLLKNEFQWNIKKKNQMNITSKIKNVRFIAELVKFGMYSKIEVIYCLETLLHDFQHHHIEMACALLEVAGIYLYNNCDTRTRTNMFLEQMFRLKTVTALDSRHSAQIEHVYYLIKPPQNLSKGPKQRPPIHEYIRHIIFEKLSKANVEKSIKYMRKLNWDDPDIMSYACKCLSKAYELRFPLIKYLADLVSGLSAFQENAAIRVVDTVLEDIRAGLESDSPELLQRRIAMAKYLGELHNYQLIDPETILNTLYSIISFGVPADDTFSPLDPPNSLFRVRLACVLLDTCGVYFPRSFTAERLDYFLMFFQRYYLQKKSNPVFSQGNSSDLFPFLIDHMYRDCLANLRPRLKLFTSLEQAKEAIEKLKSELYPQLNLYLQGRNQGGGCGDPEQEHIMKDTVYKLEPHQRTKEDVEFAEMFQKIVNESMQERATVKAGTQDIPVPMMAKKTYDQLHGNATPNGNSVPFFLMIRGNHNKHQFRPFQAPADSPMALNLRLQEDKIKEEKETVKELTLSIGERLMDEDYQESVQCQLKKPMSPNKSQRKPKKRNQFEHQKGAPESRSRSDF